jgi:hypothetical protein
LFASSMLTRERGLAFLRSRPPTRGARSTSSTRVGGLLASCQIEVHNPICTPQSISLPEHHHHKQRLEEAQRATEGNHVVIAPIWRHENSHQRSGQIHILKLQGLVKEKKVECRRHSNVIF